MEDKNMPIYGDINLKTKFSYYIYISDTSDKKEYFVYECDIDGNMQYIAKYNSFEEAKEFVSIKSNT